MVEIVAFLILVVALGAIVYALGGKHKQNHTAAH